VSVPLATVRELGNFTETFTEYGWEDIELGLRLRAAGVKGIFNRFALAYHYKPPPRATDVDAMIRQRRAQARTAVQLRRLHPQWRVVLATGDDPVRRGFHRALRVLGVPRSLVRAVGDRGADQPLGPRRLAAARALATEAYYEELDHARRSAPPNGA
jgi:hypothetical protein